ncbi:MAG: PIN domain-containing protein [Cyanobacteria bacterium]|jgi:PIN domain nuclease of toxin-antitoxin system|nr:PIN domain-containing protein [Cyanobacteria bacterium GSL.Bin1]
MNVLIDTHTFLWFINDSPNLSSTAKDLLESDNEVCLSLASIWEIAIKVSLGKLALPTTVGEFIPEQLELNQINILPIQVSHLDTVASLPFHHRDPFDRLIIAQAICEQISVVSVDQVFDLYEIKRLW